MTISEQVEIEQENPTSVTQPVPIEDNPALDNEQDKMFDWDKARSHLERLVSGWNSEKEDTEIRRKTRDVEVNVEALRQKGQIDEDETFVPVRVIDTNITREQPSYINYLKNSRRLCIFSCLSNPETLSTKIELDFTAGMTYADWERPHFKCIDGAQTHAWAAIEVVYDESKPLFVGLEYVAHEDFIFPKTVKDIQDSPRVARKYDVTISALHKWVAKYGFDGEQIRLLVAKDKDTQQEIETKEIYKVMFKKEGVVYVAWFALKAGLTNWLKAPAKLYIGIEHKEKITQMMDSIDPMSGLPMQIPQEVEQWKESDVDMYPYFKLDYRESEKPKEFDRKGRVYLDENKQEASTAIISGFINGLTRASNVYASPKTEDGSSNSIKEIDDLRLCGGRVLSKPMDFWSPPYPDPMVINALQFLDTQNSNESGQINFTAMNRQDSRKTATEMGMANQEQTKLTGVQLTLFSGHIRKIYSFVWRIVQTQALKGKIKFLLVKNQRPQISPLTQQPLIDPMTSQPVMEEFWENDYKTISEVWDVRAAGDVDVIQKEETVSKMKQDWPVVANTVIAPVFLADLLRLEYPDVGNRYADMLMQQGGQVEQLKGLVARLGTVMNGMMEQHPEMLQTIPAQQQKDLQVMMQEAGNVIGEKQSAPQQ
jgi:hypothetical protein